MKATFLMAAAILIACSITPLASGDVVWNEAVNGPLSGNGNAPTAIALGTGSNVIKGTASWDRGQYGPGNREFFTVNVPAGMKLEAVFLRVEGVRDDINDTSIAFRIAKGTRLTTYRVPVVGGTDLWAGWVSMDNFHVDHYTGVDNLLEDLRAPIGAEEDEDGRWTELGSPPFDQGPYVASYEIVGYGDSGTSSYSLEFVVSAGNSLTLEPQCLAAWKPHGRISDGRSFIVAGAFESGEAGLLFIEGDTFTERRADFTAASDARIFTDMLVGDDVVYLAGRFSHINGQEAGGVARYRISENRWETIGGTGPGALAPKENGKLTPVNTIAIARNRLYAGLDGVVRSLWSIPLDGLGKWEAGTRENGQPVVRGRVYDLWADSPQSGNLLLIGGEGNLHAYEDDEANPQWGGNIFMVWNLEEHRPVARDVNFTHGRVVAVARVGWGGEDIVAGGRFGVDLPITHINPSRFDLDIYLSWHSVENQFVFHRDPPLNQSVVQIEMSKWGPILIRQALPTYNAELRMQIQTNSPKLLSCGRLGNSDGPVLPYSNEYGVTVVQDVDSMSNFIMAIGIRYDGRHRAEAVLLQWQEGLAPGAGEWSVVGSWRYGLGS